MPKTPNAPLEEITLSGYKSIRELKALRLDRGLNVLIGANGSGKTNFIRFFELLGHMMDPSKGLQNYVSQRRGADAFLFRGAKVTPELSAHLTFGQNEYKFTLRASDDGFSLFFAHESAPFSGPYDPPTTRDQGSGHRESRLAQGFPLGSKSETWTVTTLQGWRVHHFHDTSPGARIMGLINIVDNDTLHSDAGNLAAFLMRIARTHPEHFARIVETVRQVAPFFGAFVLKEVASGQTQLLWKDRYCDLVYYPSQLSDGTLRYICLATLLLQPDPPPTLIIDEPELGLHPLAIKLLASLLHDAAQRGQLIVSTQSSLLLDEMDPEQVIVTNQRDGATVLERLDDRQLGAWLEEYTLGQLWEKNQIGGNP
ncbi:MAG: AAA family ATPase [Nannocystis sp.]|nr:AAA family ATPase [Nannocystis sp.]MBA3544957.1 AAA family ATPase [Nannocystis sp.]